MWHTPHERTLISTSSRRGVGTGIRSIRSSGASPGHTAASIEVGSTEVMGYSFVPGRTGRMFAPQAARGRPRVPQMMLQYPPVRPPTQAALGWYSLPGLTSSMHLRGASFLTPGDECRPGTVDMSTLLMFFSAAHPNPR